MMKPVNSLIKTIAKNKEGQSKLLTKNEQNFDEFVQDELGDTVFIDETTGLKISKGAKTRMEKRLKEEAEHKKRLSDMKAKKKKELESKASGAATTVTAKAKPKFDRSKLNTAFMTNAKKGKDEVNGWALDFENEA